MYLSLKEWLSTTEDKCSYDSNCIVVTAPQKISLQPLIINEIYLEELIGDGYILQVKVHVNKPWRVMNEFIHPNPHKNCLIFPILTNKPQEIQVGDTICHVKLTLFTDVLHCLKGNDK
jgi:hypothetical protein